MDIKLPHQLLVDYLKTTSTPRDIARALSLCGPTVDRLHQSTVDSVYDIEIITNRIDSVSAFGIAREAAAILPQFELNATLTHNPYELKISSLGKLPQKSPLNFQILDAAILPRLTCIALENVTVKDSPQKTQNILHSSGLRPLNNVIDISNELTLRFGLPVHIFDLDKIPENKLIMRESKKGETITTLDGKKHTLKGGDIVINDANGQLIDLCGIMGGESSMVDENTKNVLLFVPVYEPKRIRHTSLYTQNRSLAAQIYEKGPDPEITIGVLVEGVKLLQERAGGTISSQVFDFYPNPITSKTIKITQTQLDNFIGIELAPHQIETILTDLGFTVTTAKDAYSVKIPSWRDHDINIWPDLVEEIARVYGYFRLPKKLPLVKAVNIDTNPLLNNEMIAKNHLTTLGFTEILTSSLISAADFTHVNLPLKEAVKLQNPLSEDFEYLRTSLIPAILKTISQNQSQSQIKIYELSNVYYPDKKLAQEISTLTLGFKNLDFRTAKGHLEVLLNKLNCPIEFVPLENENEQFVKNQTAQIMIQKKSIGFFGVIKPKITRHFDINDMILAADLNFAFLNEFISHLHTATKIPRYASVFEDINLESNQTVTSLIKKIKAVSPLIINVDYLSSHENKHTFHLEFNDKKGNLTQKQVNQIKAKLLL